MKNENGSAAATLQRAIVVVLFFQNLSVYGTPASRKVSISAGVIFTYTTPEKTINHVNARDTVAINSFHFFHQTFLSVTAMIQRCFEIHRDE